MDNSPSPLSLNDFHCLSWILRVTAVVVLVMAWLAKITPAVRCRRLPTITSEKRIGWLVRITCEQWCSCLVRKLPIATMSSHGREHHLRPPTTLTPVRDRSSQPDTHDAHRGQNQIGCRSRRECRKGVLPWRATRLRLGRPCPLPSPPSRVAGQNRLEWGGKGRAYVPPCQLTEERSIPSERHSTTDPLLLKHRPEGGSQDEDRHEPSTRRPLSGLRPKPGTRESLRKAHLGL